MKPTRAPGISESTPSSIPTPARRIGQTATFLPRDPPRAHPLERRLDLDLLVGERLRRLVGEEERQLVDELTEHLRRRRDVAQEAELVPNERMVDLDDVPAITARTSCSRGSRG